MIFLSMKGQIIKLLKELKIYEILSGLIITFGHDIWICCNEKKKKIGYASTPIPPRFFRYHVPHSSLSLIFFFSLLFQRHLLQNKIVETWYPSPVSHSSLSASSCFSSPHAFFFLLILQENVVVAYLLSIWPVVHWTLHECVVDMILNVSKAMWYSSQLCENVGWNSIIWVFIATLSMHYTCSTLFGNTFFRLVSKTVGVEEHAFCVWDKSSFSIFSGFYINCLVFLWLFPPIWKEKNT